MTALSMARAQSPVTLFPVHSLCTALVSGSSVDVGVVDPAEEPPLIAAMMRTITTIATSWCPTSAYWGAVKRYR